ncbi:MAG: hypothetical protein R3F23_01025 [Verrucomicrobiia bacterium]
MFKVITRLLRRAALRAGGKQVSLTNLSQLVREEISALGRELAKIETHIEALKGGRIPEELMAWTDVAPRIRAIEKLPAYQRPIEMQNLANEIKTQLVADHAELWREMNKAEEFWEIGLGEGTLPSLKPGEWVNGVLPIGAMEYVYTEPSDVMVGLQKGEMPSTAGAAGALSKAIVDPGSAMVDVACETIPGCSETIREGESKIVRTISETVSGAYDAIVGNNKPSGVVSAAKERVEQATAAVWQAVEAGNPTVPPKQPSIGPGISTGG